MSNQEVYRPRSNWVVAGAGILITALFVWSSFYDGGVGSEITSLLLAAVIILTIYIFIIRPKVTFCDEGVVITNPITEFRIGWSDVILMDSKWAFTIETKTFTVSAWAATAPGRHHARNIHINEITGLGVLDDESMRTADSPRSHSGAAIYRAKVRQKRFHDNGTLTQIKTEKVRDLRMIIAAALLLVAAIATALLV